MCSQRVDVRGRDLGDESGGVSEAANHREQNAENDLRGDSNCIKSGSGQFRGAFEVEKIEVVWTYCKMR